MANRRLSEDYITWTLTLNASQAQEEIRKLEKDNKELQKQTTAARKAMTQLEAEGKKGSAEWKNLQNSVKGYNRSIAENKAKIDKLAEGMKLGDLTANQLKKRLKELERELNNTSKAQNPNGWNELNEKLKACKKALKEASEETQTLWQRFKGLTALKEMVKGGLWSIGQTILDTVVGAFKQATSTIMDFESSNAKLAAILGTNIEGISSLTEQAKFLGRTTTATASDVTSLQTELAKLGFATDSIEAMTPAVLKFSQAVDTDLGRASAFAGAALRIFGKDAADTEDVLASFAIATTKSSLDFGKLETALSTAGPVAAAFGMTIEDTAALLGQLANSGFDASSAATATRNILLNMADSSGDLAKALGKPVTNLDELVQGLNKLNREGVDLAKALDLTDKSSVAAFQSFLAGADSMIELRDSITGVSGEFNEMAATMADTAAAGWAGLESAIEGLVLKFFDFREVLKGIFNAASETVTWMGDLLEVFTPLEKAVMTAVGAVGKFVGWLGSLVKNLTDMVKASSAGKAVLNALVVAVVALKVASVLATDNLRKWKKAIVDWVTATKGKIITTNADTTATNLATAATRAFNTALKSNPIGLVVTLLATLVTAIMSYRSAAEEAAEETDELTKAQEKYKDAITDANVEYEKQKDKIEQLVKVQNDETLAKEERIKAINELNRIIPGYNAQLEAETGKVRANTEALNEYIVALKKKLQLEANRDYYKTLIAEDQKTQRDYYNLWKNREKDKQLSHTLWSNTAKHGTASQQKLARTMMAISDERAEMNFTDWYNAQNTPSSQALARHEQYMKDAGLDIKDPEPAAGQTDLSGGVTPPGSKDKVKSKGKSGGQPKKDPIAEIKKKYEPQHRQNLHDLEMQTDELSEADYALKKNEEIIRHCREVNEALEELGSKTKETDTELQQKIFNEQMAQIESIDKAERVIAATRAKEAETAHKNYLAVLQEGFDEQDDIIEVALQKQDITRDQAAILRLRNEKDLHADQMAELRRYYAEVEQTENLNERDRAKALESIAADIRKTQSQILTDTGRWAETVRSMMTNPESLQAAAAGYELERRNIEGTYAALMEFVEKGSEQAVALEAEKNRRLAVLNYEYREQQWQIRENAGLTMQDEYERQLNQLKSLHARALLDEKGFQKKKLELQVNTAKAYYDYYSGLSTSMFTAIQNAEIATSDAKYDVLIRQAKNAGEETAALEEEKENAKLEIQKKYADVDFAIKISQIIADTSVAIMKAFSQLGPIGGAVASAMLTATGVVHKGEYVVPMPIMQDPRVIDAVGLIESIRQQRVLGRQVPASSGRGFADGGLTSPLALDTTEFRDVVAEMRAILGNIRAYVVYQDIEQAGRRLDLSRAPFTRGGSGGK